MKKVISFILISALTLSITACSNKANENTDLDNMHSHDVETVEETKREIENEEKVENEDGSFLINSLDASGNLVTSVLHNDEGEEVATLDYNKDGYLTKDTREDPNLGLVTMEYKYDENGRCIEMKTYQELEMGRSLASVVEYEYYETDNKKSATAYNSENNMVYFEEFYDSKDRATRTLIYYDLEGNIITEEMYTVDGELISPEEMEKIKELEAN